MKKLFALMVCVLVLAGCVDAQTAEPVESAAASVAASVVETPAPAATSMPQPESVAEPESEVPVEEPPAEETEPGFALPTMEGLLYVGYSFRLQPYSLEEGAPEGTYTFACSDAAVAAVSEDGVMKGLAPGVCTIAVADEGGYTLEYTLTVVTPPAPQRAATGSGSRGGTGGTGTGGTGTGGTGTGAAGGGTTGGGGTATPAGGGTTGGGTTTPPAGGGGEAPPPADGGGNTGGGGNTAEPGTPENPAGAGAWGDVNEGYGTDGLS